MRYTPCQQWPLRRQFSLLFYCVYVCCIHVWKPENSLSCHSSKAIYLIFETRSLTGLELAQQAGLTSQPTSPRDAPVSTSQYWNDECTPRHSYFFYFYETWVSRDQAQVLMLPKQALNWDSSLVHLFLHVLIFTLSTATIYMPKEEERRINCQHLNLLVGELGRRAKINF